MRRSRQSKRKPKPTEVSQKNGEPPDVLYMGWANRFAIKEVLEGENEVLETLIRDAIESKNHALHYNLRNRVWRNQQRLKSIEFCRTASEEEILKRKMELIGDIITLGSPDTELKSSLIRAKKHTLRGFTRKTITGKSLPEIVKRRLKLAY